MASQTYSFKEHSGIGFGWYVVHKIATTLKIHCNVIIVYLLDKYEVTVEQTTFFPLVLPMV
jgi:hypothetical protein